MKWIVRIILVLALLSLIPVFFAGKVVSRLAVQGIEEATGFNVAVEDIQVGILRPVVRIQNLVLTNPPEYPHPEAISVREAFVSFNWFALLGREIKIKEIRLDVPRLVMVRPEAGGSNLEDLARGGHKKDQPGTEKPGEPSPPQPKAPEEEKPQKTARDLTIEKLTVRFGEMEIRQYKRNDLEPVVMTIPVNLDRTYDHVTNVNQVATALATELAMRSGIGLVGNLDAIKQAITDEQGKLDPKLKEQVREIKNLFKRKPE